MRTIVVLVTLICLTFAGVSSAAPAGGSPASAPAKHALAWKIGGVIAVAGVASLFLSPVAGLAWGVYVADTEMGLVAFANVAVAGAAVWWLGCEVQGLVSRAPCNVPLELTPVARDPRPAGSNTGRSAASSGGTAGASVAPGSTGVGVTR